MDENTKNSIIALARTIWKDADKIVNYLHSRWLDEREYEDFNDYIAKFKEIVARHPEAVFVTASKRPFGFTYKAYGVKIRVSATTTSYGWKAIK